MFSTRFPLCQSEAAEAVLIATTSKRRQNMLKSLMILVVMAPALLAQGGANCKVVGGAILTNFLDPSTTLGTATGDLKGGLGVTGWVAQ
jgi:hypothetical protein